MNGPPDAVAYWRRHIARSPQFSAECECVAVILLNSRMRMRGHHIVSVGSLNQAMAEPREVFRLAVMAAAHSVILMHNHPSGEPDPSGADCRITRNLRDAGSILGIPLVDHIIVGQGNYFSFAEHGSL
ncbi:MAG: JAB domain-containing protein [Verrucomicrobiota bacterium]